MLTNLAVTRGKLANRYFVIVFAVGFIYNLAINAMNISFAVYVDFLGYGQSVTGLAGLGATAFCVIARIVSSHTTDRIGRRFTMVCGCIIYAVTVWLCGMPLGIITICIARSIQGYGFAAANTGASAANIDTSPPEKLGIASALFYVGSSIGLIICGIIVAPATASGRYTLFYNVLAGLLVVGAVISWLCSYESLPEYKSQIKKELSEKSSEYKGGYRFFEKSAMPMAFVSFLECMGLCLFLAFMLLYGEQNAIPYYGHFFTVSAVTALFCNFTGSRLAENGKTRVTLLACFIVFFAALLCLAFIGGTFIYFLSAVVYGASYGLSFPLLYLEALVRVPVTRRGAAGSTLLIANDIGFGAGTMIWGVVIGSFGFSTAFIMAGGVYLAAAVLTAAVFRHNELPKGKDISNAD